jgi:Spy/CpxP family protein refolding chaperone
MAWTKRLLAITATLMLAASAATGCGGSSASHSSPATPVAPSAEDEAISAGLRDYHQHHHHGGVTLLITLSLDALGVSPDQKAAIDKIHADLLTKLEPARAAEQALHTTLADGIAAGGIDHAKADAALAQVSAAAAGAHDATADALDQLHAALTPEERGALADKLVAHWQVWQKATADEQRDPSGQPRKGGRLAPLAAEIGLTPEQIDKIHAALASSSASAPAFDGQEIDVHVRAFADAFRADSFEAKTLAGATADAHLAGAGAARMVRFYEAVDTALTADQRTKLAAVLREHASTKPGVEGA